MTCLVHIGDVHLQAGHPRNDDRLKAFDQIVDEGLRLTRLGAWLVPGDLFHARSTIADRNDLADRLVRMANAAPVCLCRGNHDLHGELDIFAKLKTVWPISVVTQPAVIDVRLATGDHAAIACLPYPDKAGLISAAVAPGEVPATAAELLDAIFMQLAHELSTLRAGGAIPLFMGHVNVRGAVASTGQPQIGQEQEIDRLSLERLGVAYCALSHIHKPQEVGAGVYAGSIAAMDHGETHEKSYVVVNLIREFDQSWTAVYTREPIQTPPMYHIAGELTRDGFFYVSDPKPETWAGCDVRVRVSFKASERGALNFDAVAQAFAGALRLKIETIAIPDRDVRQPEVAAATTLPAKLAAYRKEEALPPAVASKVDALLQQTPEQLLAGVAASLAAIEAIERAMAAA